MLVPRLLPKYLVGAVTVLLVSLVGYYRWSFQYWKRKNIQYLKPRIPFGNLVNPLIRKVSMGMNMWDLYKEMKKNKWTHGGIFLLLNPVFYVVDLDLISNIMTEDQYFVDCLLYYNEKDDAFSAHRFAIGASAWRNLRPELTPPFTTEKMKAMFQIVLASKNDLLERIEDGCAYKKIIVIEELFLTGFEPSSKILTFALYELAKHQDIQKKLRKKILTILDRYGGEVTYQGVQQMKYMDKVIYETLRKHPPVSFLTRTCIADYEVPNEDVVIDKGTTILVPIYGLHHDEEYFPEPEKFDPGRFSEDNRSSWHRYAYIPFGEGPRMCKGMHFVLLQCKVGLIALLKNFNYTLNMKALNESLEIKPESFMVMAEDGKIWLDAEKVRKSVDKILEELY